MKITPASHRTGAWRRIAGLSTPDPSAPPGSTAPPDCCEPVDPDTLPDRASDEEGGRAFTLDHPDAAALVQSEEADSVNASAVATVTLPGAPTPGNVMVATLVLRSSGLATGWPAGWTTIDDVGMPSASIGGGTVEMRYRIVQSGDSATLTITKGSSIYGWLSLVEFSGIGAPVDTALADDQTSSPAAMSVGPATAADDDSIAVGVLIVAGIDEVITPGGGMTLIDTGQAGASPTGSVVYDVMATGNITMTGSSGTGISNWAGMLVVFGPVTEPTWSVLAPRVIDADDATAQTSIAGPDFVLVDLGAEMLIGSTRLLIDAPAGAKTYTIWGANELDLSDLTSLVSLSFTATGDTDTVTATWLATTAYRYYMLRGPSETVDIYGWELREPVPSTNHQHGADGITYDNGTSGLTADDIQTAIDELAADLAALGTPSQRWEAVTNGENVFVWEGDDLVHEWKEY